MQPTIPPPTMTTRDMEVVEEDILRMLSFLPFAKRARRGCRPLSLCERGASEAMLGGVCIASRTPIISAHTGILGRGPVPSQEEIQRGFAGGSHRLRSKNPLYIPSFDHQSKHFNLYPHTLRYTLVSILCRRIRVALSYGRHSDHHGTRAANCCMGPGRARKCLV